MDLLKQLFSSKKFMAMLSGVIGLVILRLFKVTVDPATIAEITGLIAVYIGAQGISDSGKGKAQVGAIANIQAEQKAVSPAEKIDAIKSV